MTGTGWVRVTDAACVGEDPEIFFATSAEGVAAAKRICLPCPYRTRCLFTAQATGSPFGTWGATSEEERRATSAEHGSDSSHPLDQEVVA